MQTIKTIITDGLNNKDIITRLNNKYPKTNFKDTRPEIIQNYKIKLHNYTNNFINQYGFPPKYINKSYLKNLALKASAYYNLFNNNRVALIIDYPATIHKSDNGFQSIKKPTLDKLTYGLINTSLNNEETAQITLVDQSTLAKVNITKNLTMDEILTELTSQILTEPVTSNIITDTSTLQATELYELASLYDIEPEYKNLITYSTHTSEKGNTYTNMYPRSYPTDATLQELEELINLYKEYGIINDKTTKKLKQDREKLSRMLQNLNTDLRHKAVRTIDYEEKLSKQYATYTTYTTPTSIN